MELHHILFETERFNISEVKDHFINPCCFGEDLADWLKGRLNAKGMHAGEAYQEDWGWEFSLRDNFGAYYIGVGGNPAEPAVSKNHAEWRVMVSKRRSIWDRLTSKNRLADDEPVIAEIFAVLKAEPDFSKIHEE
jgi:hypothetical protein